MWVAKRREVVSSNVLDRELSVGFRGAAARLRPGRRDGDAGGNAPRPCPSAAALGERCRPEPRIVKQRIVVVEH